MKKTYAFKTKVWLYPGMGGWHFVTIPKNVTDNIDFYFREFKRGWGSLPVLVSVGKTSWKTSIFPDKGTLKARLKGNLSSSAYKKEGSYILPLKKEVRKKEEIGEGDNINFTLEIKA